MIRNLIIQELNRLLCETHQKVCAMRDEDMEATIKRVYHIIESTKEPISIQTAIAQLETSISDTN